MQNLPNPQCECLVEFCVLSASPWLQGGGSYCFWGIPGRGLVRSAGWQQSCTLQVLHPVVVLIETKSYTIILWPEAPVHAHLYVTCMDPQETEMAGKLSRSLAFCGWRDPEVLAVPGVPTKPVTRASCLQKGKDRVVEHPSRADF